MGRGDAADSDARTDTGAGQPDGAQDGGSGEDACGAGVSSPVCLAEMGHIAVCNEGTVPPCECTYLKGSCETLASSLSDPYQAAYVACAATKGCDPLAVDDCAYYTVADAGLTSQQQKLLSDYCATCDPTNAACPDAGNSVRLFAAEFTATVAEALDNECATTEALGSYIVSACGTSTSGVTPACCLAAFKTCESAHGLTVDDGCDGGSSPDAGSLPDARSPFDGSTTQPDASSPPDAAHDASLDSGIRPPDSSTPDSWTPDSSTPDAPHDASFKDVILMVPDVGVQPL